MADTEKKKTESNPANAAYHLLFEMVAALHPDLTKEKFEKLIYDASVAKFQRAIELARLQKGKK